MINTIKQRIAEVDARMSALNEGASDRVFTAEEADELERLQAENTELHRELKLREGVAAAKASNAAPQRKVKPEIVRPAMAVYQPGNRDSGGFKCFNHFLTDVRESSRGRTSDVMAQYVRMAADTNQNETTAADGGTLVPTEYRRDIVSYVLGQESLLPRTDSYDSFSHTLVFPYEAVQSFTGTLAPTRTVESGTIAEHKAAVSSREVKAYKLAEAVNLTDELMQDSLAAERFIVKKVGEKFVNSINSEIISGSGTGSSQALGFLASAALKTVASASGQTGSANLIIAQNLIDMYYSMPYESRANAIWILSPSVEPKLPGLVISGTQVPAYQPPGMLSAAPYGTILGRPYVVSPHAKAVGEVGDISFVDLSKYLTLVKSGGVKQDVSIHAYFLSDVTTYRFTMRWGGTPWPSAVITWPDASTQSPFVALAARS